MSKNKLYLLLISIIITKQYDTNFKPTIGIYAMPYPKDDYSIYNQTLVGIPYIRWLESSGANVLIIQQWYSNETFDEILNKINGLILHGGTRSITWGSNHTWENGLEYIYHKSIEKKIPIFGICLGFLIINRLVAEKYVNQYGFNNIHIIRGFNVTDYNSKMFSLFNESLLKSLNDNSGYYNHKWGVNRTNFNKNVNLKNTLKITSISKDNQSMEFINSIEGINDYIYATQFHPEKTPFQRKNESDFDNVQELDHEIIYEKNSIRVTTLLGIFFVEECRKNKNRFDKKDKDKFYFIDTYGNNNQNMTINYTQEIYIFSRNKKKDLNSSSILDYLFYAIVTLIIIIITIIKNYILNNKQKKLIDLEKEKEKMKEKENKLSISTQNEELNLLKKM